MSSDFFSFLKFSLIVCLGFMYFCLAVVSCLTLRRKGSEDLLFIYLLFPAALLMDQFDALGVLSHDAVEISELAISCWNLRFMIMIP